MRNLETIPNKNINQAKEKEITKNKQCKDSEDDS